MSSYREKNVRSGLGEQFIQLKNSFSKHIIIIIIIIINIAIIVVIIIINDHLSKKA